MSNTWQTWIWDSRTCTFSIIQSIIWLQYFLFLTWFYCRVFNVTAQCSAALFYLLDIDDIIKVEECWCRYSIVQNLTLSEWPDFLFSVPTFHFPGRVECCLSEMVCDRCLPLMWDSARTLLSKPAPTFLVNTASIITTSNNYSHSRGNMDNKGNYVNGLSSL